MEDIHLSDWRRILIGEVPLEFYLEVVVRTVVIFVILIASMRMIGKKIVSQVGQSEMIATIVLAAAVGISLQSPDRGLIPALIIALVVILVQKGITRGIIHSEKFETLTQDSLTTLIRDGVCELHSMKRSRITPERLRAQLRNSGIRHLGEVNRLYLEANGSFTLLQNQPPKEGICILPDWDKPFRERVCKLTHLSACRHCGQLWEGLVSERTKCTNCGWDKFEQAVI